ncbi:MAG: hypothetical protein ACI90V_003964, partial [Bacillariaceae sp.]
PKTKEATTKTKIQVSSGRKIIHDHRKYDNEVNLDELFNKYSHRYQLLRLFRNLV